MDGDGERGDRLDAGQVGYGEGQADYKTQDQDKDKTGDARDMGSGVGCSPGTTGEATPRVGNRKTSTGTEVCQTPTTKSASVPVDPATLSSDSLGPQA